MKSALNGIAAVNKLNLHVIYIGTIAILGLGSCHIFQKQLELE